MEKIALQKLYISRQNIPLLLYVFCLILLYCNGKFFAFAYPFVPYINLCFSLCVISKICRMKEKRAILFLLAVFYVVFASMVNGSSFGAASAFLAVFAYILYFEKIHVNDSFMKILLFGGLCMILWYLPKVNTVYSDFIAGTAMYSPNSISMVLVVIFIWFSTYFHMKREKSGALVIILYLCIMAMVFMMKTRSAMAILLLYGILFWGVPRRLYNRKKLVMFTTVLIITFGCIFPVIYVSLSSNSFIAEFIYKLTGKYLFTGRDLIWKRFFTAMKENEMGFLIGLGSHAEYSIGQGLSLHNSYLNIILNYGIGGIVILAGFLCLKIKDLYRKSNGRLSTGQISLMAGYLCVSPSLLSFHFNRKAV